MAYLEDFVLKSVVIGMLSNEKTFRAVFVTKKNIWGAK